MRTLEKIFPVLFGVIGITLVATWFALTIMGSANMLVHILFLFTAAFIFELYSSNQQYKAEEANRRKERDEVEQLLKQLKDDELEEMMQELEEEYNL